MAKSYFLPKSDHPVFPPDDRDLPIRTGPVPFILDGFEKAANQLRLRPVRDFEIEPYASTALLIARDEDENSRLVGTAFLARQGLALTAGHCLADYRRFSEDTDYRVTSVSLFFGYRRNTAGDFFVTGRANSDDLHVHPDYDPVFQLGTDVGAIFIAEPLDLLPLGMAPDVSVDGGTKLRVPGYPDRYQAGFDGRTMAEGRVKGGARYGRRIGYKAKTLNGMSGGPLVADPDFLSPIAAIHTDSPRAWSGPPPKRSSGFRLSRDIINWIDDLDGALIS